MTTWRLTEIRDGSPSGESIDVPASDDARGGGPASLAAAQGRAAASGAGAPAKARLLDVEPAARARGRHRIEVVVDGWRFEFEGEDADRAALRARATSEASGRAAAAGVTEIRAIIPGRVASVAVIEGDEVAAGQPLLVVEAMKMQNELRAPRAGVVRALAVRAGQTIEMGDLLVTLG